MLIIIYGLFFKEIILFVLGSVGKTMYSGFIFLLLIWTPVVVVVAYL